MDSVLLDVAGHRRSPATMPGYHRGRPPRNKGEHYPADPPTVEEIVAVMRAVSDRADGQRLRALVVLLWRAGLRISEALALQETDLDSARGAILVRRGKGGLCRIRHRSPYVALGTMLRAGAGRRRGLKCCPWFGGSLP
jgi:integrase